MENANKYVLLPERDVNKHVATKQFLSSFDHQMANILHSRLGDHEKIKKYYELLQKKMNLQEYNQPRSFASIPSKSPPPPPDEEKPQQKISSQAKNESNTSKKHQNSDYADIIINSVPSNLKKQAGTLLDLLRSKPDVITWTPQGELLYKNQKIEGSNMADLFNVTFTNKKNSNVNGKSEFLRILHELNAPKHFIKNKSLLSVNHNPPFNKKQLGKGLHKKKNNCIKWSSLYK